MTRWGEQLILDLLRDPQVFNDGGRAYDLLQTYFDGFPIDSLAILLRNADSDVQRAAVFVASELGSRAHALIDDVLPLMDSGDRYLQYHAIEIITVCCDGDRADEFGRVVLQLENTDEALRSLAMRMLSGAESSQIDGALRFVARRRSTDPIHADGLRKLVTAQAAATVIASIRSTNPLERRYGAIMAKRQLAIDPALMEQVGESDDRELREFHRRVIGET